MQDFEEFISFEDCHLVYGEDADPYKSLIPIHLMIENSNLLFYDSLTNAAQVVAGFDNDRMPDVVNFSEEGFSTTVNLH